MFLVGGLIMKTGSYINFKPCDSIISVVYSSFLFFKVQSSKFIVQIYCESKYQDCFYFSYS